MPAGDKAEQIRTIGEVMDEYDTYGVSFRQESTGWISRTPRTLPSEAASAVALWREKIEFLRQQEAITSDPAQKFSLKKQIQEAEAKIAELGEGPTRPLGGLAPGGPGRFLVRRRAQLPRGLPRRDLACLPVQLPGLSCCRSSA